MRVWDISPKLLCVNHLLGEHAEIHAIWNVITKNRKGYSRHPETLRWKGKLKALYLRHETVADEMKRRGFSHRSILDLKLATGKKKQTDLIDSTKVQKRILKRKKCRCQIKL